MSLKQTPTVFAALLLSTNQFDLFDEIAAEAVDIIDEFGFEHSGLVHAGKRLIFLEVGPIRFALGWSSLKSGDVLTLAIGSRGKYALSVEEAHVAGKMLRELVSRSDALFEVMRPYWQIAVLPLDAESMEQHALQLSKLSSKGRQHQSQQFISVDPKSLDRHDADAHEVTTQDIIERDAPSLPLQASALALSTTFVLVTPPVGIAMFTYAVLRQSVDMDLLPRNWDFLKSDVVKPQRMVVNS